jgi:hypothetical protein
MNMMEKPSSVILTKVSEPKSGTEEGNNGQFEFITYKVGLYIPRGIHSQIQTKSDVWGTEE